MQTRWSPTHRRFRSSTVRRAAACSSPTSSISAKACRKSGSYRPIRWSTTPMRCWSRVRRWLSSRATDSYATPRRVQFPSRSSTGATPAATTWPASRSTPDARRFWPCWPKSSSPDAGTGLYVGTGENTPAQSAADVGHDPLQQRIVGPTVVDDVIKPAVVQVGVDATVDGPDRVDLFGELGSQKVPGDGL